ncbi:invasion associated locus B family protein [Roseobacter sp. HKCCA0434]|uniref:invasion associated locus B family protein n=1 Tax=Roseobacter sp. HKCCA0434 TaxID=3079297 RepID=UPI00290584D8|nr:invasion associated locus B family protein [Roseobacter sp. HKCCA0434]
MRFRILPLAALVASLALPTLAQQGPTTGFEAPRPAPAPAPQPAPEPEPEPAPEPSAPAVERTGAAPDTVREEFNDWELRCVGETDECILFQTANNEDGRPAAEFSLVRLEDGNSNAVVGVTLVLPLGVVLTEGIAFRVDQGRAQRFGYNFCIDSGCVARFALNQGAVDAMKAGNILNLRVAAINVPTGPIDLQISLAGFTAAMNALP